MYLSICGDPDCPNKTEVERLNKEIKYIDNTLKMLKEKYDEVCKENEKLKRMCYGSKLRRKY